MNKNQGTASRALRRIGALLGGKNFAALAVAATVMAPALANAHTVQICWRDQGGVTTFYAGSYHSPFEAPSPIGKIFVDGFGYPFSGWIYPTALPTNAHCWTQPSWDATTAATNPDGKPASGLGHYQTFTSGFALAAHTIGFDSTTAVQSPWAPFPTLNFGGGACADADFDGICNDVDTCPLDAANDGDHDGLCANADNCPTDYNPNQADANHNGQGDICEGVVCGNGLLQGSEQCDDGNKAGGDGCSAICTLESKDADNDGINDSSDNCPTVANASQLNTDGDSQGDACDADDDNDGVLDTSDNCPLLSNADQLNHDGDTQGDACDADDDNDGIADATDNCPYAANADQADNDTDGQGDACDGDDDNDGVADASDNCIDAANVDQADTDADGQGDVCDADDDNDGFADVGAPNCTATVCNGYNFSGGCQTVGAGVWDFPSFNDIVGNDNAHSVQVGPGARIELWEHYAPYGANAYTNFFGAHASYIASSPNIDGDGINGVSSAAVFCDVGDNCPLIANPDQLDTDGDHIGDACDSDDDNDGIDDTADNCPLTLNADQANNDGDAAGDACDADDDNDGIADTADNCQFIGNADQANNDGDAQGDSCDDDDDNDSVADLSDNCQFTANADQTNTDGDSLGDACDPDLDGDGVLNVIDNCPAAVNADQSDLDSDGQGDICDADMDGDGVINGLDNCQTTANAAQADLDGDGQGDACDADIDGDGVLNTADNCVVTINADQANNDGDSQGDACDADDDNDGVLDTTDNCHFVANASQSNFDGDTLGDACDPDDDNDAVADGADQCPSTVLGTVVDPANGCAIAQLCPCSGPRGTILPWKNHGKYVECVEKSLETFEKKKLITEKTEEVIKKQAAQSSCGKSPKKKCDKSESESKSDKDEDDKLETCGK